ncbi:MAG: hypothetical protein NTW79_01195 [Candidatus Berkelbacteria bacterium]|nr:hypothetical protein [Candidatus Berkelbacteria bacterium]
MKLNPLKTSIALLSLAALATIFWFGVFDFSEYHYHTEPEGLNQNLDVAGDSSAFTFTPIRNQISGLEVYFHRDYLIAGENQKSLELTINYKSLNNQPLTFQKLIKISEIKKGLNQIKFLPLKVDNTQPVAVKFVLLSDLDSQNSLKFFNRDMNPDEFINTSPRIIYHENIKHIARESWNKFSQDRKFSLCYEILLAVLIGFLVIIIIFDPNSHRR